MNPPLVTVVIPYYDHGRHLHQTVHSCLRAYSGPIEILIVNDGSVEPKAGHYLENAAALSPAVRVITQANGGLSTARNTGIREARGALIQLLDSDDMLVPGKIDAQVEHFQLQPAISVSLSNYLLSDPSGTTFWRDGDPITRFDFSSDDFLFHWERGFSVPIHTALFRRDILGNAPFETSLVGKEDWVFWSRLALAGRKMSYLPVFGAIYRQHAQSMSKSFKRMGESFLSASRLIESELEPRRAAAMRQASQKWHQTFYVPRSREDKAQVSASSLASQPDADPEPTAPDWPTAPANLRRAESETPLISVIVPVYNHYRYLQQCLASVLAQTTDAPIEIVVINDASSDQRVAPLLRSFATISPVVNFIDNTANLGIAETQNRAAAAARGAYLAFLDCDDMLSPDAFANVIAQLDGADYVFTDRTDVDASGRKIRVARYGGYDNLKPSGDIRSDLYDGMVASHLKVIRREAFLAAGGFDRGFGGVQDWELALKMAQADAEFRYLPQPLYLHRIHGGSVTGEDAVRQFWLSNLVRRRFARSALRPQLEDDDAVQAARTSMVLPSDKVALFRGRVDTAAMKAAWRQGKICIYAVSVNPAVNEINALREYNSYFDLVLAPDESVASALVGYMWRHDALHLEGERVERRLRVAEQAVVVEVPSGDVEQGDAVAIAEVEHGVEADLIDRPSDAGA